MWRLRQEMDTGVWNREKYEMDDGGIGGEMVSKTIPVDMHGNSHTIVFINKVKRREKEQRNRGQIPAGRCRLQWAPAAWLLP